MNLFAVDVLEDLSAAVDPLARNSPVVRYVRLCALHRDSEVRAPDGGVMFPVLCWDGDLAEYVRSVWRTGTSSIGPGIQLPGERSVRPAADSRAVTGIEEGTAPLVHLRRLERRGRLAASDAELVPVLCDAPSVWSAPITPT